MAINIEGFKKAAIQKGISTEKIDAFLVKKGLMTSQAEPSGKVNFLERLKAGFGDEEAKARGRQLEEQAGLRGRLDIGDIADIAGAVPSLAGFIGGEALAGPAGAIGGSAAGEAARQGIGRLLGVQKQFEPKKIAGEAIAGGVALGAGKLIGKGLELATKSVPIKLVRNTLDVPKNIIKAGKDPSEFLVKRGVVGDLPKFEETAIKGIERVGKQIQQKLTAVSKNVPGSLKVAKKLGTAGQRVESKEVLSSIYKRAVKQFGGAYSNEEISAAIKRLPLSSLVEKESLTVQEANSLRSVLDKLLGQDFHLSDKQAPLVKELVYNAANTLRGLVQKRTPGTKNLFKELSHWITTRDLAKDALAKGAKQLPGLGLREYAGTSLLGLPGLIAAQGTRSPAIKTGLAVGLQKIGQVIEKKPIQTIGKAGKIGLFEFLRQVNR